MPWQPALDPWVLLCPQLHVQAMQQYRQHKDIYEMRWEIGKGETFAGELPYDS